MVKLRGWTRCGCDTRRWLLLNVFLNTSLTSSFTMMLKLFHQLLPRNELSHIQNAWQWRQRGPTGMWFVTPQCPPPSQILDMMDEFFVVIKAELVVKILKDLKLSGYNTVSSNNKPNSLKLTFNVLRRNHFHESLVFYKGRRQVELHMNNQHQITWYDCFFMKYNATTLIAVFVIFMWFSSVLW